LWEGGAGSFVEGEEKKQKGTGQGLGARGDAKKSECHSKLHEIIGGNTTGPTSKEKKKGI